MAESKKTSTTDKAQEEALKTVRASQSDPERPVSRSGLAGDGVMATSLEERGTDRGEPQDDTTVNDDNQVLREARENEERLREVNDVSGTNGSDGKVGQADKANSGAAKK